MNELKKLGGRLQGLSAAMRLGIAAVVVMAVAGVAITAAIGAKQNAYQYVFTGLSQEDGAQSGDALRAAGIPFRIEGQGDAIAVPADKVHDARLLLASKGLPRASGVGFELFDKGDLGVSEFTQRVNLQRATEGELQRTISSMSKVKDARVHITMPKRGLLRGDDRGATAAVMIKLHPGRSLDTEEIAGVRHLVAAAVPQLSPEAVTLVDGAGTMLGADGDANSTRETLERELERRITTVLEPALGRGAVVARVTATMDADDVDSTASVVDPNGRALKSDHVRTEASKSTDQAPQGLVGAQSNQPLQTGAVGVGRVSEKTSDVNDATRSYEVSSTVTRRISRQPRLTRLSIAVLLDQRGEKPIPAETLRKLTELSKRAVGYDEDRGDLLELTTANFTAAPAEDATGVATAPDSVLPVSVPVAVGALVALLLLLAVGVFAVLKLRKKAPMENLTETASVQTLELPAPAETVTVDPRGEARRLAIEKPDRAAKIILAWLESPENVDAAAAATALNPATPPAKENARG